MSQFKITQEALRQVIREELLREAEAEEETKEQVPGTPGSASKGDVVSKLKELIGQAGDIPSSQYGAFLAVLDEVLELAMAETLKAKAKTIVTGLNKFDK